MMNSDTPADEVVLEQWICTCCGYMYDPEAGDPEHGISPGTAFEDLPEDWRCPVCVALKQAFEQV
jgi:rubredoxin